MELTFLQFCKELVQLESAKNLLDMLLMGFHVLRVDEDVIKDTMTQMSSMSAKIVLTNCWTTVGALVRPKGITNYS